MALEYYSFQRKKGYNMKKKNIIICGAVKVILIVIAPIILDSCILGNDIKSNVGNDIWRAFFGSYFGGLFGAVATLFVLYDTQNSRKRAEKRNKKKQKKQQKLSIRPCLQVRERGVGRDETINKNSNNVYYVLYEKGNTKHRRRYPKALELLQKTFFYYRS